MGSYNRKPPKWILKLPPGEYEIIDLQKITGLKKPSIYPTIKKYGAKIKKIHSGYNNLYKNVYIWKGYTEK